MKHIEVKTQIVVLDEHTLGLIKAFSNYIEILQTSINVTIEELSSIVSKYVTFL